MTKQIRLILASVALSALIWTYADRIGQESTTLAVPVTLIPDDPDSPLVFRVVDAPEDQPNVKRINLTFRGPKAAIRQLETEFLYSGLPLTVRIEEELNAGRHSRNLFADLERLPAVRRPGLALDERISPQAVAFDVDRYREVSFDVRPVVGSFEKELKRVPVINPTRVEARVLESKLGGLGAPFVLTLALEDAIREELGNRLNSDTDRLSFTSTLPDVWRDTQIAFRPPEVRVTVEFKSRYETMTIAPIKLWVTVDPREFLGQFEIEWQEKSGAQFTQAVDVSVPIEKLDQVRALDPKEVVAYVTISTEDSTESLITREVRFAFPDGFDGVEPVKLPEVQFYVRRKADTAEGTTPAPAQ